LVLQITGRASRYLLFLLFELLRGQSEEYIFHRCLTTIFFRQALFSKGLNKQATVSPVAWKKDSPQKKNDHGPGVHPWSTLANQVYLETGALREGTDKPPPSTTVAINGREMMRYAFTMDNPFCKLNLLVVYNICR
jgi:hypothetical protein